MRRSRRPPRLTFLHMELQIPELTDAKREAVAASAEIIGAKWTALLIYDLAEGKRRFRDLEHSCAGISSRTLAERLRALERAGIVRRFSYPESPPRVEYELTEKGRDLLPVIEAMTAYGRWWLVPDAPFAGVA
jgi:DNA-binding HxlR family transcriptional regulator